MVTFYLLLDWEIQKKEDKFASERVWLASEKVNKRKLCGKRLTEVGTDELVLGKSKVERR